MDLGADRDSLSAFIVTNTAPANLTSSQSGGDLSKSSTLAYGRVEGAFAHKVDDVGEASFGTEGDSQAPSRRPRPSRPRPPPSQDSTKAYLALADAIGKGNKAGILAASPPDRRAMIDPPEFPQPLKAVQAMPARNIKVLKASETGHAAVLIASGTEDGTPQRGKIKMTKFAGKWVMAGEPWRPQ
jgi:hypothetical protein